ncbi:chemotaxis protein MotA [Candidatus Gastranaerophilus sp. (ex Termes propinquus)]|nr:chemotaxis protein MotA [Candidatus Gastranaerophilus sp. (ex Termes propinquus)]
MDIVAFIGAIVGVGLIYFGMLLEGGSLEQVIQITAALIVFGGTAGAVILSFPKEDFDTAFALLGTVFFASAPKLEPLIKEIVEYAQKVRKEGVIILEKEAQRSSDPLLAMGLEAVADGADPSLVKSMMETQLAQLEAKVNGGAKVWESAGGYAPTVGIVGAVIGLIQVMQNLDDPAALGAGIAVAFVATIYGLIGANLYFIPISTRAKFKYQRVFTAKELMIEGVLAIQAGESPAIIERKLSTYIIIGSKKK